MKIITLLAAVFVFAAADANAQSKDGNTRNQAQTSTTLGQVSQPDKPNSEERPTNVSQTREQELEKENGYYQMKGERDWGTNAQMNGYPYPTVNPSDYPQRSIDTSGVQIQSG